MKSRPRKGRIKQTKVASLHLDPLDPIGSEQRFLTAFMKAADKFDEKHARSPEAARAQLLKEGIITKTGRLTKRYGG